MLSFQALRPVVSAQRQKAALMQINLEDSRDVETFGTGAYQLQGNAPRSRRRLSTTIKLYRIESDGGALRPGPSGEAPKTTWRRIGSCSSPPPRKVCTWRVIVERSSAWRRSPPRAFR
jgi:hypothetical protein